MITGLNTDVRCGDSVFHVQTEDRGNDDPVIDTLIYRGGQILEQIRTSYADRLAEGITQEELSEMLDAQHRDALRRARQGQLVPDELRSVGDELGSDVDLADSLAAAFEEAEPFRLLDLEAEPRDGGDGTWRLGLRIVDAASGEPVPGARILARGIAPGRGFPLPVDLETDEAGEAEIVVDRARLEGVSAVILEAEDGPGGGRLRFDL
jgi:hypothetical protein